MEENISTTLKAEIKAIHSESHVYIKRKYLLLCITDPFNKHLYKIVKKIEDFQVFMNSKVPIFFYNLIFPFA